jgi:hypothetical protein
MKHILTIITLLLGASSLFAGEKEEAFKTELIEAFAAGEKESLALIEIAPTTPQVFAEMIQASIKENRKRTITGITFLEPKADSKKPKLFKGKEYISTLPVTKRVRLDFDGTDDVSFFTYDLGLKGGSYKIVTLKPKK